MFRLDMKNLRKDHARSKAYSREYRKDINVYWCAKNENFVIAVGNRKLGEMVTGGFDRGRMRVLLGQVSGSRRNKALEEETMKERSRRQSGLESEKQDRYKDAGIQMYDKKQGKLTFTY